jgi:hypothetical protein
MGLFQGGRSRGFSRASGFDVWSKRHAIVTANLSLAYFAARHVCRAHGGWGWPPWQPTSAVGNMAAVAKLQVRPLAAIRAGPGAAWPLHGRRYAKLASVVAARLTCRAPGRASCPGGNGSIALAAGRRGHGAAEAILRIGSRLALQRHQRSRVRDRAPRRHCRGARRAREMPPARIRRRDRGSIRQYSTGTCWPSAAAPPAAIPECGALSRRWPPPRRAFTPRGAQGPWRPPTRMLLKAHPPR